MATKTMLCECNDCGKETNSRILFKYQQAEDILDDDDEVIETFNYNYFTIQCLGCNYVSFISEMKIPDNKKGIHTVRQTYSEPSNKKEKDEHSFLTDKECRALPPMVRNVYEEVEEIFLYDTPILSGIGLRTMLESICVHQNIKGRNLKDKIDNLHRDGLIASKDLPVLHNLREIGNITVHQIKRPNQKTLDYSLEILNHTLKSLYVIPRLHAKIKKGNIPVKTG
jgi:hypothetical protein